MLPRAAPIGASLCLRAACTEHPVRVGTAPIDIFTAGESGHSVYCISAATRLASGHLLVFVDARVVKRQRLQ